MVAVVLAIPVGWEEMSKKKHLHVVAFVVMSAWRGSVSVVDIVVQSHVKARQELLALKL